MMELSGSRALLFRKTDYGEADIILSFFTEDYGRISVIAKAAKKSQKRFGGVLELFSLLEITATGGKQRGMPMLQEARLVAPFEGLRKNYRKMAYAAYWYDLVNNFLPDNAAEPDLFKILCFCVNALAKDSYPQAFLSVTFQAKLIQLVGLSPANILPYSNLDEGTKKQLLWVLEKPLDMVLRTRFSNKSINAAEPFLQNFLTHELGRKLKTLEFLEAIKK